MKLTINGVPILQLMPVISIEEDSIDTHVTRIIIEGLAPDILGLYYTSGTILNITIMHGRFEEEVYTTNFFVTQASVASLTIMGIGILLTNFPVVPPIIGPSITVLQTLAGLLGLAPTGAVATVDVMRWQGFKTRDVAENFNWIANHAFIQPKTALFICQVGMELRFFEPYTTSYVNPTGPKIFTSVSLTQNTVDYLFQEMTTKQLNIGDSNVSIQPIYVASSDKMHSPLSFNNPYVEAVLEDLVKADVLQNEFMGLSYVHPFYRIAPFIRNNAIAKFSENAIQITSIWNCFNLGERITFGTIPQIAVIVKKVTIITEANTTYKGLGYIIPPLPI